MKAITHEELKVMLDGLLIDYAREIKDSLLARFYGIYEIKIET